LALALVLKAKIQVLGLALGLVAQVLGHGLGIQVPDLGLLALKVVFGLGLGLDSVGQFCDNCHLFWVFTVWHSSLSIVINSNYPFIHKLTKCS